MLAVDLDESGASDPGLGILPLLPLVAAAGPLAKLFGKRKKKDQPAPPAPPAPPPASASAAQHYAVGGAVGLLFGIALGVLASRSR